MIHNFPARQKVTAGRLFHKYLHFYLFSCFSLAITSQIEDAEVASFIISMITASVTEMLLSVIDVSVAESHVVVVVDVVDVAGADPVAGNCLQTVVSQIFFTVTFR
jgi:hypothetical protein